MKIEHKFEFVEGSFEMTTGKIISVSNKKYGIVDLCFKESVNIPFARIKLHSKNLTVDADAVFDNAVRLGAEIVRRWNYASEKL